MPLRAPSELIETARLRPGHAAEKKRTRDLLRKWRRRESNGGPLCGVSCTAVLAIDERLAAQDPSNASSQNDLACSYESVGKVLCAMKDARGACQSYRQSLAIFEKLIAAQPDVPQLLEDKKELVGLMRECKCRD